MQLNDDVGTGIEVWGHVSKQSAPFVVSIDGWQGKTFQRNNDRDFHIDSPQLLFFQYGLAQKSHTLSISNYASDLNRSTLDIHRLNVADKSE